MQVNEQNTIFERHREAAALPKEDGGFLYVDVLGANSGCNSIGRPGALGRVWAAPSMPWWPLRVPPPRASPP
jgi:hypothetical protein